MSDLVAPAVFILLWLGFTHNRLRWQWNRTNLYIRLAPDAEAAPLRARHGGEVSGGPPAAAADSGARLKRSRRGRDVDCRRRRPPAPRSATALHGEAERARGGGVKGL